MNSVTVANFLIVIVSSRVTSTTDTLSVQTELGSHLDCNSWYFEGYLRKESRWIGSFFDLLTTKKEAFSILRKHKDELSLFFSEIKDRSEYLGNLLNAFSLVQRMTRMWPPIMEMLKAVREKQVEELPKDLEERWMSAVTCLVRVQEVYNISSVTLAEGRMRGTSSHAKLKAGDCFDIAVFYYKLQHQERSVEWLLAALERSHQDHSVSRERLLEYLHLAQCFKGDSKSSVNTFLRLQQEFPSFRPSAELLGDYSSSANQSCPTLTLRYKESVDKNVNTPFFVKNTKGLCRNDLYQHPNDRRLRCRMIHYNLNHLKIGPFKIEELNLDPPLLKVYDAICDNDIQHLRTVYAGRIERNDNKYSQTGELLSDPYLDTQHQTWLRESDPSAIEFNDPVARRLSQRSAAIVNLNSYKTEDTMLAWYGLGGELKVHTDCRNEEYMLSDEYTEADYLTILYYLNDVPEGGFSIFPRLNLSVKPEKGTAIIFFNRYPDWSRIDGMVHSGCPVIRGNKWIVLKAFHVRRQDFPKCVPGKEKSFLRYYL